MRIRLPLPLKFIGWFLLNLALLAVVFFFLLRSQFGIGLSAMLEGKSGEKITRAATLIGSELRNGERDEWGIQLARFSIAYGVRFSLFRSDGRWVRGEDVSLPEEVTAEIRKHSLPVPAPRRRPSDREPPNNNEAGARKTQPLFLIKAGDPPRYWIGARVQVAQRPQLRGPEPPGGPGGRRPGNPGRPEPRPEPRGEHPPDILLASTTTLGGNELLPDLRPWFAVAFGAVALSVLFWIPFVRGITRSLRQMRDATREVAAGKFDTRISEERSDELGQLGQSINRMSSKLERYVDGQNRFLGDIAHELCSPIARMQMAIGVLEQRSPPELASRVDGVREELEQMASMVNELLSFSKASISPEAIALETVPLGPLINEIARRETGGKDAEIGIEEHSGIEVLADKNLLGRALGNLVRNAMRYAGDAGPISIDAEPTGDGKVLIRVRDRGPGVPEDTLPHLFDPFYRPDAARNREAGGAGLGLAIVRTCIEACGGDVQCRNANPGFEVDLTLKEAGA